MAFHLPALLTKAKAFLATPKGRKTALIGAGGAGAVVLGLRAKKKGGPTIQEQAGDALDKPTPSDSGGFTFPSDPIVPPDSSVIGGGQTTTPPFTPFVGGGSDAGGGGGGGGFFSSPSSPSSPSFQTAVEMPDSDPTLPLPAGTIAGPALFGAAFGMSLPSSAGGAISSQLANAAVVGASAGVGRTVFGGMAGGAGKPQGILSRIVPAPPAAPAIAGWGAPPAPSGLPPGVSASALGAWLGGLQRAAAAPPPPPKPAAIAGWSAPPKPVSFGYGGVKPAPPPAPITKPFVRFF